MNKLSTYLEVIINKNGGTPNDWNELVKIVNSKPDEAKLFCIELKKLIKELNPSQQLIGLDLLDYIVEECGLPLHTQVSSKDFITFLLSMLKTRDSPELQLRILYLIKKWGLRFENKRDVIPNFYETYSSLQRSKVVFPEKLEANFYQYLGRSENSNVGGYSYPDFSGFNINDPNSNNANLKNQNNQSNFNQSQKSNNDNPKNNYGNVWLDLNPDNYPKKYKKFVAELVTLLNYITLANEMIDNVDFKKSLDEGVREMVSTVRDLDKNLQMAIQNQIEHEGLMAICLGINDDIIQLFKRYDVLKTKKKPDPFLSSFHTDYAAYNLNYKVENSGQANSESYGGFSIDTGKKNIGGSNSNMNQNNPNLIDFGFVPNNNLNNNNNNQNSGINQIPSNSTNDKNKINDINDIFG